MPTLYLPGRIKKGASIHLKYSYGSFFSAGSDTRSGLQTAVDEGQSAVTSVITHMEQNKSDLGNLFNSIAKKYFLIGDTLTDDEYDTILNVMKLTNIGIGQLASGHLKIKIFKNKKDKDGKPMGGYVTRKTAATRMERAQILNHWTDIAGTTKRAGDIHLRQADMANSGERATIIFVHEATHKFADTADFGDKGYTDANNDFIETGLTRVEAFMNAESYAQLAVQFGGP